jgi:gas vesicle protein
MNIKQRRIPKMTKEEYAKKIGELKEDEKDILREILGMKKQDDPDLVGSVIELEKQLKEVKAELKELKEKRDPEKRGFFDHFFD